MLAKGIAPGGVTPGTSDTSSQIIASPFLEAALAFARKGLFVFPLCPRSKVPFKGSHGKDDATTNAAKINEWWTENPDANIAINPKMSGLVVIDPDRKKGKPDGVANFRALGTKLAGEETFDQMLRNTPLVKTGTGYHIYFKAPPGVEFNGDLCEEVQIMHDGYVLAPPSIHPDGKPYIWVNNQSLLTMEIAELPEWWYPDAVKNSNGRRTTNDAHPDNTEAQQLLNELPASYPPSDAELVIDKCPFLKHCVDDAKTLTEPDWYHGLIGVLPFCTDGEEAVHRYSNNYPKYKHSKTQEKIEHRKRDGKGPSTCEKLGELAGGKYCGSCPFKGKITSPIILGYSDQRGRTTEVSADIGSDQIHLSKWPQLSDKALPGLAGDIVRAVVENSEADPAAVLITFLGNFAASVGPRPYVAVGDTKHPARLFSVIVGASSRARKGTSADPIRRLFKQVAAFGAYPLRTASLPLCAPTTDGPLSTGEGLIHAVRDASILTDEKTGKSKDPGVQDKRLFAIESEFGAALRAGQRDGNTLSAILRMAWDRGDIHPLIKNNPTKATGAHICIVGHITRQELLSLLQGTDVFNGFANRFLWLCARRSKLVPIPKGLSDKCLNDYALKLADVIEKAQGRDVINLSPEALQLWTALYPELSRDRTGMIGAVTARAEAQVTRIALVYALLTDSDQILPEHIDAALALWQYCEASAACIFGDSTTDPNANRILVELSGGDKTLTELNKLFSGHLSASKLSAILSDLQAAGRITVESIGGGRGKGKSTKVVRLTQGFNLPCAEFEELEE